MSEPPIQPTPEEIEELLQEFDAAIARLASEKRIDGDGVPPRSKK